MIRSLFDSFAQINDTLDNKMEEISVKQSRISIDFEDKSIISISDLTKLNSFSQTFKITDIASFQDSIFVIFNLNKDEICDAKKDPFCSIYSFILILKEHLCSCPMLEFQISQTYIKIYIDLPNIYVKDLSKVEEIIGSKGTIEFNGQRTYVLYVKDWQ